MHSGKMVVSGMSLDEWIVCRISAFDGLVRVDGPLHFNSFLIRFREGRIKEHTPQELPRRALW